MLKGAFKRRLPRVAAPTFSILGIFWMLSTIFGASGLGRKQSEQAQFSIFFRKTVLSAQMRGFLINISILFYKNNPHKMEKARGESHSSERNCVSL